SAADRPRNSGHAITESPVRLGRTQIFCIFGKLASRFGILWGKKIPCAFCAVAPWAIGSNNRQLPTNRTELPAKGTVVNIAPKRDPGARPEPRSGVRQTGSRRRYPVLGVRAPAGIGQKIDSRSVNH